MKIKSEPERSLGATIGTVGAVSRRDFLRRAGIAGGLAFSGGSLAALLAACGGASATPTTASSGSAAAPTTAAAPAPTTGAAAAPTTAPASASPTAASAASPASSPAAAAPTTAPAGGPVKRGGTLNWAYTLIPIKLDPVWSSARTDQLVLAQVIEGLVRNSRDSKVEAAVASKWDVSADGLTYTFTLRPGVKFHNGKEVTPEDVIASLGRSKAMGTYKWTLAEVTSVDKVDAKTVKITLSTKVASFLPRLAVNANAIFPKEEIDKIGKEEFTQPIGTGPFVVKEWVRNDKLILDKNPNYWENGADGKPFPYLDQLVFRQVAESSTQVLQVQAGSLQGSEGIPWSQIPTLEKDPRGQLVILPQQQVFFMVLQLTRPPFDDLKVRQAMSLALDRKVFVDRATSGKAEVANSFFPKSAPCWDANAKLPYDLAKAKKLIAESKYPNGHSGAKLQLTSGGQTGRDNAVIAKDMWDKIGIKLTIEEVEGATLAANWYKDNFDVISGYQWTNGMLDPEQHVQFFFVDPRMHTGYQPSARATDLVKAATQELDPVKRCAMFAELQNIYNDDVGGTISLYYTPSINYLSPEVKNFFRTPLGVPFFKDTWLAK